MGLPDVLLRSFNLTVPLKSKDTHLTDGGQSKILLYGKHGVEARVSIDKAILQTSSHGLKWCWIVNLRSFEPIHGLSRIVLLVPDKLATAIEINKEKLPDPKDDGSFLIDLVLKLCGVYANQIRLQQLAPEDPDLVDLLKSVEILEQKLEKFKNLLPLRSPDDLDRCTKQIAEFCDVINGLCTLYLEFVHPVWVQFNRNGGRFEDEVEARRERLDKKLEKNKNKILVHFEKLSNSDDAIEVS